MVSDQHGFDFLNEFIFKHNIDRFIGGFGNSHSQSSFYYVGVLLIGFFPWVLLLPSAIWQVIRQFGTLFKSDRAENVLPLIGLLWLVTIVAFFSFSATKLAHYIAPAIPGAAMNANFNFKTAKNIEIKIKKNVKICIGFFLK